MIDADGDGISGTDDQCPNTPQGAVVGPDGCSEEERDSDGDGVVDIYDPYPNDPTRTALPIVTIDSPENLLTVGSTPILVTGSVDESAAAFTVNGQEVQNTNGSWQVLVELEEGHNTIVARMVDNEGVTSTASITVSLDLTPPHITIESHEDGQTVYTDTIAVSGLVNDIVRGTIEEDQAIVVVNGIQAQISNRSYLVTAIPLVEGQNEIRVSATDQVGQTEYKSIFVNYQPPEGQRLELVSGQNQSARIDKAVQDPLVVRVLNETGEPLQGKPVVFRVVQGSGKLQGSTLSGRGVVETSNELGLASVNYTLGFRSGVGNQKVAARVVGFDGEIIFHASAEANQADKLSVNTGNNQRGGVFQPLPVAFVVAATDDGSNAVQGARVQFKVESGNGSFVVADENSSGKLKTVVTDSDGRASAHLVLGGITGLDRQRVTAYLLDGPTSSAGEFLVKAGFTASAFVPGDPGQTSISGIVVDNQDNPLPGTTILVDGTSRQATADASGKFTITEVPVGPVHLLVDGSTTTVEGEYPTLSYNLVTVSGVENPLPAPVYMVKLNTENAVFAGNEDVELTLPEVPGFKLEVPAGSVTFPDGSKEGFLSVTVVNSNKVPMAPPNGMQPQFIVTIQPTGAAFDPPARLSLPNVDGHIAGRQVEMFSYDHDLEEFVSIGLGTVSEDRSTIRSNPGVGVVKAGWHCGAQPGGGGCCSGGGGGGGSPDCGKCGRAVTEGECGETTGCEQIEGCCDPDPECDAKQCERQKQDECSCEPIPEDERTSAEECNAKSGCYELVGCSCQKQTQPEDCTGCKQPSEDGCGCVPKEPPEKPDSGCFEFKEEQCGWVAVSPPNKPEGCYSLSDQCEWVQDKQPVCNDSCQIFGASACKCVPNPAVSAGTKYGLCSKCGPNGEPVYSGGSCSMGPGSCIEGTCDPNLGCTNQQPKPAGTYVNTCQVCDGNGGVKWDQSNPSCDPCQGYQDECTECKVVDGNKVIIPKTGPSSVPCHKCSGGELVPNTGASCSDGNECTSGDQCVGPVCIGQVDECEKEPSDDGETPMVIAEKIVQKTNECNQVPLKKVEGDSTSGVHILNIVPNRSEDEWDGFIVKGIDYNGVSRFDIEFGLSKNGGSCVYDSSNTVIGSSQVEFKKVELPKKSTTPRIPNPKTVKYNVCYKTSDSSSQILTYKDAATGEPQTFTVTVFSYEYYKESLDAISDSDPFEGDFGACSDLNIFLGQNGCEWGYQNFQAFLHGVSPQGVLTEFHPTDYVHFNNDPDEKNDSKEENMKWFWTHGAGARFASFGCRANLREYVHNEGSIAHSEIFNNENILNEYYKKLETLASLPRVTSELKKAVLNQDNNLCPNSSGRVCFRSDGVYTDVQMKLNEVIAAVRYPEIFAAIGSHDIEVWFEGSFEKGSYSGSVPVTLVAHIEAFDMWDFNLYKLVNDMPAVVQLANGNSNNLPGRVFRQSVNFTLPLSERIIGY